jgi:hypothetical protein
MSAAAPPNPDVPEVALDADGRVAVSQPCRICGYDLQGLEAAGACPECAAPVARSIRGDLLRFADPDWVGRLARGLRLTLIGSVGMLAVSISSVGAGVAVGAVGTPAAAIVLAVTAGVINAALAVVIVVGVWLATGPDRAAGADERLLSARRVARWGIFLLVLAAPLQLQMDAIGAVPGTGNRVELAFFFASTALYILSIVGWLALLVHLRRLTLRVPRPNLALQATIVLWGYAVVMVLFVTMTVLVVGAVVLGGNSRGASAPVALVAAGGGCFAALGYLVFEVWFIVLLVLFSRAFGRCAREARQLVLA